LKRLRKIIKKWLPIITAFIQLAIAIKSVTTGARKIPNLPNYYNNGEHMISRLTLIISIIAFVLSVYNLLVILGVL